MNRIARTSAGRISALLIFLTIGLAGLVSFNVVVESRSPEPTAPNPAALLPGPVIDVDRSDDEVTATACTAAPNDCSLRGAIIAANAVSGTTINVPAGTYSLTIAGASEQFAAAGDLDVRGSFTTIVGAGAASTVIQQTTTDRVFEVNPALSAGFNFTISGVTIKGGNRTTGSGGGMLSGGPSNSTTITDCIFDNNRATGALAANGGAISDSSSSGPSNLTITGTTFLNNVTQTGVGGAVRFNSIGTLTLVGDSFIGNRSNTNGGGAVNATGPGAGGTYTISQASFEGNQALGASSRGGAVFAGSGILTVRYSRLVGNTGGAGVGTAVAQTIGSVGSISVNDNWWGTNSGPTPTSVFGSVVTNWLQQRFTATPSQVQTAEQSSLVTDFLGNSAGGQTDAANLVGLPPFPSTPGTIFVNPLPQFGTISAAATQFVNGQATATYTAGSQGGSDDVTATADAETLTATIGVVEPASISCPGNITAQTDPGECTANVSFAPSAAGFPSPSVTCSIGSTPITSPHAFPVGTTTVTCTASNGVGEDASCTFTVTVTDNNAPVVTAPSNVTVNTGAGAESCGAFVSDATLGSATATDGCDGTASITRTGVPAGNIFPVGTTTVTYTATDANGNTGSATQTVTVIDNTAPTITAPANASYECSANVPAGNASQATASDNCGTANVTLTESNNGGAGSSANPLIITRVYTATDAAGNTASATQTITVIDNTAPTLSVPGPVTLSADSSCQASVPNVVSSSAASDNCAGSVTVTQSPAAGTSIGLGTHTITVTATDAVGNTSTATTSVTVTDMTAPSVTAPSNVTVNTGAEANACGTLVSDATLGSASTSDNCGGAVTVARSGVPAGNIFPVGTTTVTYTATDANGNSSIATQTVTVVDNTAPTITAPANATYECAANVPAGNASQATASDNCGTANVTVTESNNGGAGSTASPLVITRVYTATDGAGNTASATQTITVVDTSAPALSVPAATTVSADSYCQATVPNVVASSTASDNCAGSVTVTQSPSAGTPLGLGTHTITVTATDAAGNTTTATTSLTIADTTAPSLTAPGSITVPTGSGSSCSVFISDAQLGTASSSDNCSGSVSVTRSGVPAGNVFPVGQTTITYTATDAAGNTTTATQVVNVADGTAPVITLNGPNPLTVECHTAFVDPGATANDNCGGSFAATASGTVNPNVPGTYTITYSATDASGNQATPVTRTVIVQDSTAPVITIKTQPISLWSPNHKYQTVQVTDLVQSVVDSCNNSVSLSNVVIASVTSDEADDSDGDGNTRNDMIIAADCKSVQLRAERNGGSNGRVYTITLRVRDSAGNVGTATKQVTVPTTQNGAAAIDDGPRNTVTGNCP